MILLNKKEDKGRGRGSGNEMLIIFGDRRARRGAELKVMSGVDAKTPDFFTKGVREKASSEKGVRHGPADLQERRVELLAGQAGDDPQGARGRRWGLSRVRAPCRFHRGNHEGARPLQGVP